MASLALAAASAVGSLFVARYLLKGWLAGPGCKANPDLNGKVVIVTGSNTGIGYETAKRFAVLGARVIMACRNKETTENAIKKLLSEVPNAKVEFMQLNLGSLASIRKFSDEFHKKQIPLHILVNNAGVFTSARQETEDGFEMQLGTNHLGHFLLTNLLLDILKQSGQTRIVNVASKASERGEINFDDLMLKKSSGIMTGYSQSKLANVLFTQELAKRLKGTNVTAYSLHPGVIQTDLLRNESLGAAIMNGFSYMIPFKTTTDGAQTTLYCSLESGIENLSGRYFSDCIATPKFPNLSCEDPKVAERLWIESEKLVGFSSL